MGATFFDPFPVDTEQITMIALVSAASLVFATLSSFFFEEPVAGRQVSWRRIAARPPLVIWLSVVGFFTFIKFTVFLR
jgi:peptidoglycan/LPS O-acetylase OafA/YrhL